MRPVVYLVRIGYREIFVFNHFDDAEQYVKDVIGWG